LKAQLWDIYATDISHFNMLDVLPDTFIGI